MGNHLRVHGVNLFPEVIRLGNLVEKVMSENKRLVAENNDLKSRLRLVLP
jgi:regulator of replication initiation timing